MIKRKRGETKQTFGLTIKGTANLVCLFLWRKKKEKKVWEKQNSLPWRVKDGRCGWIHTTWVSTITHKPSFPRAMRMNSHDDCLLFSWEYCVSLFLYRCCSQYEYVPSIWLTYEKQHNRWFFVFWNLWTHSSLSSSSSFIAIKIRSWARTFLLRYLMSSYHGYETKKRTTRSAYQHKWASWEKRVFHCHASEYCLISAHQFYAKAIGVLLRAANIFGVQANKRSLAPFSLVLWRDVCGWLRTHLTTIIIMLNSHLILSAHPSKRLFSRSSLRSDHPTNIFLQLPQMQICNVFFLAL